MTNNTEFYSLSRTLCSNTHKGVLIKNAFQHCHDISKLSITSPKQLTTDMTLFSGAGIRGRIMDLQPINDPFIVDNIFKSPKKRRRGLLSWSAMPLGEMPREKTISSTTLREFPRHVRARNRRRSILGSKYRLSSMRRRRSRSNGFGDHIRSISDPTTAISPSVSKSDLPPPLPYNNSLYDMTLGSSDSINERMVKPFIATTPLFSHTISATSRRTLLSFPKLSDEDSFRSSSEYELSGSYDIIPINPQTMSSTLRGVPGHPTTAACAGNSTPSIHTPPYISISAMRLFNKEDEVVTQPPPALLRSDDRVRTQRYASLPCNSPVQCPGLLPSSSSERVPARVIFDPAWREEIPRCPVSIAPFEVSTPQTKFRLVKNSLDIRQPALASAKAAEWRQPSSTSSPEPRRWQLPSVLGVLRRLAICGGTRKR
ncbi:hypothetical protein COEREDRAFT_86495 [Coemansia reversa NRRL 1564]|uniref:Uncharacterized protein n=1 Tax=Coemansia reversa (strain ATCC 12441 / NRRL 1564) TaxID=763665 RepID=A0A2G5BDK5_COERN|nr:hypothetical protein COEREDRAFT_86495 [Coemansia reversa NRRL 1564]|eukprot:PIA17098.1 hypothetical protein COEREDRAFT_86495 [Coemansia reversa NRRL 1564]